MTVDGAVLALLVLSAATCVFVYFGYPAVLLIVRSIRRRPIAKAPVRPTVSMLVPAHNEADVIGAKVANSLALDYPVDRLEILVVSDGSTDGTESAVESFHDPRVRLLRRPREGKIRALAAGAEAATGDVLVLTDANSQLEPDALALLVESFADPDVGAVCGNKRYRDPDDPDATGRGEGLYWRWDKWQKKVESEIGSIFAADGAFYALRRELFVPVEDPAQADDIAISARVVLQGRRLVFEPRAVAWEEAPSDPASEFRRKVRVTNHSVRALLNLGRGLWLSGFYSFELLSHKLLRHFLPVPLLLLLLTSAWLAPRGPLPAALLVGQVAFYLAGGLGYVLRGTPAGRSPVLSVPYFFTFVNAAALFGLASIALGRRHVTWKPRAD